MRKFIGVSLGSAAVSLLPLVASAADLGGFLVQVRGWIGMLVAILLTLAVVVFFWGLIKYLSAVGEEKHSGLMIMFYGILTIFVMVAIWGLVAFFAKTLDVPLNTTAPTVTLPGHQYGE